LASPRMALMPFLIVVVTAIHDTERCGVESRSEPNDRQHVNNMNGFNALEPV
jgi:hypothetical protein